MKNLSVPSTPDTNPCHCFACGNSVDNIAEDDYPLCDNCDNDRSYWDSWMNAFSAGLDAAESKGAPKWIRQWAILME